MQYTDEFFLQTAWIRAYSTSLLPILRTDLESEPLLQRPGAKKTQGRPVTNRREKGSKGKGLQGEFMDDFIVDTQAQAEGSSVANGKVGATGKKGRSVSRANRYSR